MNKLAALLPLLLAFAATPVELRYPQGTLRGFPDLSDLSGRKLADGRLVQWIDGGRLHVRLQWEFPSGRRIEERASFDQGEELVQRSWSFEDRQGGEVRRRFAVDFDARRATGLKAKDGGGAERWDEQVDVTPGRTFAGIGLSLAAAELFDRLQAGEQVDLDAVAFLPKPRTAGVQLSRRGATTLRRAGKALPVVEIAVHPKVPWPIDKLIGARDARLYFFPEAPPQLLRAEAPLAEVGDPMVRIDVLTGARRLQRPQARTGR